MPKSINPLGMIPHPGSDVPGVIAPWTGKPADYKLIVDYFAGGGGASKGIELALGRSPDIAVNHDEEAIALHRANHPNTVHLQKGIWSVMPDMVRLIGNRRVELFHASPDCKHFSSAKGGQPVKRSIRDLAWVVPQFARRFRPEVITLENVGEFAGWGPLVQKTNAIGTLLFDDNGRPLMVPCKARKGQTFAQWVVALERFGYRVEWQELRASDFGTPTIRKRLFVVARCDGLPIIFPKPTHGDPERPEFKAKKLKKWRTAAEIIDWSRPCHSIFLTKEEGRKLGVKRPLVENTMARIAKGVKRFVIDSPKPFIVNLTHQGGDRVESLDEPLRTVTGAHRGEKAFVLPSLTRFNGGATGSAIDEPVPTVTANSFIKRPGGAAPLGLVEATVVGPFVAGVGGRMGQTESRSVDAPAQTLTAKADSVLVAPVISRAQHGGGSSAADTPMHTVTASGKDQNQVIAAHLMTMRNAEKPFSAGNEPTHTITAGGAHLNLVAAFLAKHFGDNGQRPGSAVTEPVSTVTATDHNALVCAGLLNMRGTAEDQLMPRSVEEPLSTISSGGRHQAPVAAFLTKYHRDGGQHARADEPLHTADCTDRMAVVTVMINGEPWVITDIGMRMLTARELFAAQGFTSDYIIDRGCFVENGKYVWRKLTATTSVRLVGNSVSPEAEYALIAANFAHRNPLKRRAA